MSYCPYCMNKTQEAVCPRCKRDRAGYISSPRQLPYGTVLENRYIIGAVLGEGGFGITYLGLDRRLGLRVAIKEYFPSNWVSRYAQESLEVSFNTNSKPDFEKGKKRFLREAQAMAMMEKQPEIVGVRDFFEAYGTAYIVMEYVDGETLKEKVKKTGPIPAKELLAMVEPIMRALSVMHGAGLTHRDISPDNLMLENGHLRLIDFGCAREAASGDETMTIVLKHGYSPIEQYKHKGQGPWTDVYALCATIYFCLTGVVPPQAVDRMLDDELIPPNELGADLTGSQEAALLKGMGVKPDDRFRTVNELCGALYQEVSDENPEEKGAEDEAAIIRTVNEAAEGTEEGNSAEEEKEISEAGDGEPLHEKRPSESNRKLKIILPAAIIAAAIIIVLIVLAAVKPWNTGPEEKDAGGGAAEAAAESEGSASGKETEAAQEISEVSWDFDEETGTLTISGTGQMDDYGNTESDCAPWQDYSEEIVSVVIEDGITSVGEYSFRNCYSLTGVSLPETLLYINYMAFSGCRALEQINIPAGVIQIESEAFSGCESLADINVDGGNETYVSEDGILFSKDMTSLIIYPEGITQSSYTVPDSVSGIADYAFSGNSYITQISISEYAQELGNFVFYRCQSLEGIDISESNPEYASVAGVLFTKNMETLICYPCGCTDTVYEVPDGVTLIESLAFYGCGFLTSVTMADSVETIGSFVFANCSALTDIYLSASLEQIYNNAFDGSAVSVLYIPDSVEVIREDAFSGCESLTDIYYAGSAEQWDTINDESNEEDLSEITVHFSGEE